MRGLVIGFAAAAVLSGSAAAAPAGERIDEITRGALDEVYQRELPLGTGDGGGLGPLPGGGGSPTIDPDGAGSGSGSAAGSSAGSNLAGSADPSAGSNAPTGGSGAEADDGTPRRQNGTPGDPRVYRGRRSRSSGQVDDPQAPSAFGGVATVLLWGLLAVVVILLVVFLIRQATGMSGEPDPLPTGGDDRDAPDRLAAVVERPRDDADQLAHEGRFAEAIHTLLLRTVHELASQNLVRITPAMTSREVLARVPMLGDARDALAGLVTAVELTWFGDDVPGEGDYVRCRQQFELFAAAYRRGHTAQAVGARA